MKLFCIFIVCCCLIVASSAETKCQAAVRKAQEMIKKGVQDMSIPACNEDGSYKSKQCGYFGFYGCYCVDEDGNTISDVTRPGKNVVLPCEDS
uniref:Thyroglobulin type-1 domain-containing protein n=1 Tax=Latrodectus hesperus TaxID=256737 RepID=E7D1U3_LATHE|nr:hypothetical protein [Latrodectus hesperus]